jgi:F-type H+-transporting ATPase subunit alpha
MKNDDVIRLIKEQIQGYRAELRVDEVGYVLQIGDGIARVYGLDRAMVGELLAFPGDVFGIVLNLDRETVGAAVLGDHSRIRENDEVKRTDRVFEVPVGEALLGRVVDPLGRPLDQGGPLEARRTRPVEAVAPGVVDRQPVSEPLQTGIKVIDAVVPIGRGQRELIIGDRQTGKTTLAVDAIANQHDQGVLCIYVAIGQKQAALARTISRLHQTGAMKYTVVVAATANDPAPLQYIAPYAGCAVGEEFMFAGRDVLIVYDDLSKHAVAYRQLSLLLRRPPGREAYPGDVFYIHSRLLERAGRLSQSLGAGSMTALPIVETQAGDFSAYVPTNVVSITDGQIYLEPGLFYSGIRPAVNVGLSVSRVGGSAQVRAMRQVAGRLRLDLAQYRELSAFAQFGADLGETVKRQLLRGEKLTEALKQDEGRPLSVAREILIVAAGVEGFLDDVPGSRIREFESGLFQYCDQYAQALCARLPDRRVEDDVIPGIREVLGAYKKAFTGDKPQRA